MSARTMGGDRNGFLTLNCFGRLGFFVPHTQTEALSGEGEDTNSKWFEGFDGRAFA